MRRAKIFNFNIFAGILLNDNDNYIFSYDENYDGPPISLTIPTNKKEHIFDSFPHFFDGLLPEGPQLEALLRQTKLDRNDHFAQLLVVGRDLVGSVTVEKYE
jgi:serine/threonine-protein kinase HipA